MVTDLCLHIHMPRTGGTTMVQLLYRIPGVKVYDTRGHVNYSGMVKVCKEKDIPVPPAFVFVRNPWSWHVSRWSWMVQQGHLKGSFADYILSIDRGTGGTEVYSMETYWGYIGGDDAQYVGRFEQYADEVVRILLAIMPGRVTAGWIRNTLKDLGRMRQATEGLYRNYYDWRLWLSVVNFDQALIKRFQYAF